MYQYSILRLGHMHKRCGVTLDMFTPLLTCYFRYVLNCLVLHYLLVMQDVALMLLHASLVLIARSVQVASIIQKEPYKVSKLLQTPVHKRVRVTAKRLTCTVSILTCRASVIFSLAFSCSFIATTLACIQQLSIHSTGAPGVVYNCDDNISYIPCSLTSAGVLHTSAS